jgi:hypothetical protein
VEEVEVFSGPEVTDPIIAGNIRAAAIPARRPLGHFPRESSVLGAIAIASISKSQVSVLLTCAALVILHY